MLYQRIMITVISVLGDFQIHRRAVEGYLLAARINHVGNGSKGTHIVIYHHSRAVHARTYSIIEDERHPILQQFFEMVILLGILRLRNDDATNLVLIEVFTDGHLLIVTLVTLRHHHTVTSGSSLFLYTRKHRHEVIVYHLRYNNSNHLHRLHLIMS